MLIESCLFFKDLHLVGNNIAKHGLSVNTFLVDSSLLGLLYVPPSHSMTWGRHCCLIHRQCFIQQVFDISSNVSR